MEEHARVLEHEVRLAADAVERGEPRGERRRAVGGREVAHARDVLRGRARIGRADARLEIFRHAGRVEVDLLEQAVDGAADLRCAEPSWPGTSPPTSAAASRRRARRSSGTSSGRTSRCAVNESLRGTCSGAGSTARARAGRAPARSGPPGSPRRAPAGPPRPAAPPPAPPRRRGRRGRAGWRRRAAAPPWRPPSSSAASSRFSTQPIGVVSSGFAKSTEPATISRSIARVIAT